MDDLMLHLLDIVMNAVRASARTVRISVVERTADDELCLAIADDGAGMTPELVQAVLEEFVSSEHKSYGFVGLGLALLRGTAELCDGEFHLTSRPRVGTLVRARMPHSHPDRPPLGDVAGTLEVLLHGCPQVDFCLTHRVDARSHRLDTRPLRRELGELYSTRAVTRELVRRVRDAEAALWQPARAINGQETGDET